MQTLNSITTCIFTCCLLQPRFEQWPSRKTGNSVRNTSVKRNDATVRFPALWGVWCICNVPIECVFLEINKYPHSVAGKVSPRVPCEHHRHHKDFMSMVSTLLQTRWPTWAIPEVLSLCNVLFDVRTDWSAPTRLVQEGSKSETLEHILFEREKYDAKMNDLVRKLKSTKS